jgi:DNA-directed RNA polymerase II subunit RPB2
MSGGYGGIEDEEPISQDDYWTVINSFFDEKGLVRQQLESFNEFIENTMQEIVDERARLTLDQYAQYTGVAGDETVSQIDHLTYMVYMLKWMVPRQRRHEITFGQIYLAKSTMTESDGTTATMFPQEARLRNLTYSAPLYVDVRKRILTASGADDPIEADWKPLLDEDGNPLGVEQEKVFIGKVSFLYTVKRAKLTSSRSLSWFDRISACCTP